MEGRKRWIIRSLGLDERQRPYDGLKHIQSISEGMYWTGNDKYPMWTDILDKAKHYKTYDEATSDLLLFVARHPEWFGVMGVDSYMYYAPRHREV